MVEAEDNKLDDTVEDDNADNKVEDKNVDDNADEVDNTNVEDGEEEER